MEKKRRILIAVLLMLSIGNYTRIQGTENIRAIEFISIFVIGALTALLIASFTKLFDRKNMD